MKRISTNQFYSLPSVQKATRNGRLTLLLKDLNVGEGILIEKSDWTIKSLPSSIIGTYRQRLNMEFKTKTVPGHGWAVLRTR